MADKEDRRVNAPGYTFSSTTHYGYTDTLQIPHMKMEPYLQNHLLYMAYLPYSNLVHNYPCLAYLSCTTKNNAPFYIDEVLSSAQKPC